MKKSTTIICLLLFPLLLFAQKRDTAKNTPRFMIMSSWGYNYASEYKGDGVSANQTFLYVTPNKRWGFGIDFGYSYTEGGFIVPPEGSFDPIHQTWIYKGGINRLHREHWYYVGPSAYWFILNRTKHQLHLGVSLNFSSTHENNLTSYTEPPKPGGSQESEYFRESHSAYGVGVAASFGYTYKITEHFGIGARGYFCWYTQAFLSGLVTLSFTL